MWPALAELDGVAGSLAQCGPRESPLKRDPRNVGRWTGVSRVTVAIKSARSAGRKMARGCAQNRFGGVRDKAPRCRSGRGSLQSFAGPPDPGAGRAQAKVAGTLDAATQTRRGEEEVRVLSSPKFAPVAGPEHSTLRWLHAAAQAADFRAWG